MVVLLSPALTEARIGSSSSGVVVVEDTVSVLSSHGPPSQQPHRELSTQGWISWWNNTAAPGEAPPESSCLHQPFNKQPTIANHYYCAVSNDLFQVNTPQKGSICGKCFEITYDGGPSHYNPSQIPPGATPGSAIIQVINSGANADFDCLVNGFKDITGLITDGVDMTYNEVTCPQ